MGVLTKILTCALFVMMMIFKCHVMLFNFLLSLVRLLLTTVSVMQYYNTHQLMKMICHV